MFSNNMVLKFSIIIALAPDRDAPVVESIKKLNYQQEKYEVIIKKGLNPSENRNQGIKDAKGEILVFFDDDAELDSNILRNAEYFFNKYNYDVVGGPQLTPENDTFFGKASGLVLGSYFGSLNMSRRYKKDKLNLDANEDYLTSANVFIKKSVFKKAQGFNPDLFPGEDPELFSRLKRHGFKIAFNPDLIVYHHRRPGLKSLCNQSYFYGYARVKKEKIIGIKPNILYYMSPSLFLIYLILLPVLYFISSALLVPAYLYIILVMLNSLFLTIKGKNPLYLFVIPFTFLAWHLSYGLGMIIGLLSVKQ